MKSIGIMSTAALFLALGISAPAMARQEKQQEKARPARQEQQARPEKQQQAQAPKQQQQRQQQQARAPKQEQQARPGGQQQAQAPKQQQQRQQQQARGQQQQHQQQAGSFHPPQRTQQAQARQRSQPALRLSSRGSGRIPEQRFHSNFGREHHFHVGSPVLVGGYSRFHYGGFWFGFAEPWPDGWYYTDDVYIDYVDDGYYMYNPYYPGTRFAISVVI